MVTVRVYSKGTGRPAKGRKVSVSFDSWTRGVTKGVISDANGEANFDTAPGTGKVYVDGDKVFEGRVEGRVMVYV